MIRAVLIWRSKKKIPSAFLANWLNDSQVVLCSGIAIFQMQETWGLGFMFFFLESLLGEFAGGPTW
jgi:hypothetical protein